MEEKTLETRRLTKDEEEYIQQKSEQEYRFQVEQLKAEGLSPKAARREASASMKPQRLLTNEIVIDSAVRAAVVKYRWQRRKKRRVARASRRKNR